MRIMIDGYNLALPQGTGVATYGFTLSQAIKANGWDVEGLYGLRVPRSKKLREVIFYEALNRDHETKRSKLGSFGWNRELVWLLAGRGSREIPDSKRVVTANFANRLPNFDRLHTTPDLFEQAGRAFSMFSAFQSVQMRDPPDIMHWTFPLPVRLKGALNIYTIHDLVPLKLPYASLGSKRRYYRLLRACIRKSDAICTVSRTSARDILEFFPEAEGKIINTYQATSFPEHFYSESEEEIATFLKAVFNLDYKGYFLYFGAIEPKKNVGRLIEGYLSLGTKTPLVIVGKRAWDADRELRILQKDENQPLKAMFKTIRRIDYLPRAMLARLIRGAKAATFPSVYEGFGLPVLEAMALGTPVLTSNVSSLPEVAGEAALLVDPYKPSEIREALRRLDTDTVLRQELARKGLAQARNFGMDRYQDRIRAMYEGLLERNSNG